LWLQILLPISIKKNNIDILFCPGNISPIIKSTKIKSQWIATIGPFCKDMYKENNLFTRLSLFLNKKIMLFSSRTSNVVIHQAEYSQKLFEKNYNFIPSQQYLIQCGKDDFYKPDFKEIKTSNYISKITNDDLLYVSHIFPYKNISILINVLAKYKIIKKKSIKLFIVGQIMNNKYYNSLIKKLEKNDLYDDIIFTGPATKDELRYAYSKCKLFIFPSLCESSGYTLIEAMSCGAPILASNKTATPFTCGEAAEYFDPHDEDQLLSKLELLLVSNEKLKILKQKSLKRASEMINYKKAADIFVDIIKSNL
jgi:glycosyltransferase involved in cell wall biosynthesis